jgi:septal ring factor EnvC (AmiA/AmiB activator)
MRNILLIFIIGFAAVLSMKGQSRRELEDQRKKTLEEISYVDNLLKETAKEKSTGINQLKIIGNKLNLRENVISGLREEIDLLTSRIELNGLAIEMMEKDLIQMRRDYARSIVDSYKARKVNPELGYILSARDFNQGYKRLKYLQQVTIYRHKETEVIMELLGQIERTKAKLQEDLDNISDLKQKEERQKSLLQQEQDNKRHLVNSFGNKERQLRKELEEKKRIAEKIESEIARIIDEEKKKSVKIDLTPEQKIIGDNFAENRGRMPWPVERGIITGQFGLQKHPVLTYVTEDNIGIEITSSGKTSVRAIFRGEVVRVFAISGGNWAIIIRHGRYFSVYQNLVNVKVKKGDNVELKQEIGEVFCDQDNGSKSILKLMIYDEKYLNPELWIAKKE